jgi:cathepsin B
MVWYGVVLSQEDIIERINKHPNAGWTAGHNPSLANYTVNINTLLLLLSRNNFLLCLLTSESSSCVQIEQFKHILGVKPTPTGLRAGVPTKTYSKSKELPKEFDARSKWSGCSTIGNILGKLN